ncbi:ABC transporter permease [Paenibacillus sp. HN-1]|uniref:ABC transporter permease n=1 Tax=Paenibacillus TaxID=44249 RepID=UPI001CA9559C|nr:MULTISPECIES: ABC transporter permease [Paenibacillus]MBY9080689.1 ABC transporter permease [Paenibacillus sp. CGMCC 1.18879]MBY9085366.1 ABC transporter permease [Paenibacillus sinensis]
MQSVRLEETAAVPAAVRKKKRHNRQKQRRTILKGLLLPVLTLIVWEIAGTAGHINPTVLPTPHLIVIEFYNLARSGELFFHLRYSLWRSFLGFLLGGSVGLVLGLWSGFTRFAEKQLDPSIQMLRTVPHLAITPLFILWFGFGEWSKILLIALGAFFPVYVNTFLGIRSVDAKLFEVAKVLQFNRRSLITKLIVPAALPNILLGIRLSLGAAWLGLVVAEMMGSSEGVGFLIMDARYFSITSLVFVGILIFAIVGKLTDSLVKLLEKRLLRWRDSYLGENL